MREHGVEYLLPTVILAGIVQVLPQVPHLLDVPWPRFHGRFTGMLDRP